MISIYILFENIIFNTKDLEYNFDKWVNSKNGKLFITGYTGSGKSTLSEKLSKQYNVHIIELDEYIGNKIDREYVNKLYNQNKINEVKKYYQDMVDKGISSLLQFDKKLIIEGIQIFLYSDINKFKNHSIIITGTSAFISFIRAYKRNKKSNWFNNYSTWDIILDIYYNLFITKVEFFIKLIKKWRN